MKKQFNTLAVHAGELPDPLTGAVAPVLVRTKTFAQTFDQEATYQYSRGKHPTRDKLEEKLTALEGGGFATTYGSGVAATAALFSILKPGDHVLCCQEVYGGTYRLLEKVYAKYGITASYIDFSNEDTVRSQILPNTKLILVETPTNPSLHIIDLALVGRIARQTRILLAVDSTFAPPCATRPFEFGADIVLQSLSKYIAGHNDVLGGALITKRPDVHEQFQFYLKAAGAVLSPDETYRVLQGVKTLKFRWAAVSATALEIAKRLSNHPKIRRVCYPGLVSHKSHELAKQQMTNGFGGVVSFELAKELQSEGQIAKFIHQITADHTIIYAESLASPETIIAYPPRMSHKSLPAEVRQELGITDGFFRLSLGFEEVEDIWVAIDQGLDTL